MTTGKQTVPPQRGNAAPQASRNDTETLIPVARIEALMAMGRAFPPVVTALSLGLLASIGASGWLVYRDLNRVPVYFMTDGAGRAVELVPLAEPAMTRDQVAQFVMNALLESMSMDYANYKETQSRASKSYTQSAFNTLIQKFTEQGIYDTMLKRQLVLRAVATGSPRVVAEGPPKEGMPYAWVVQAPVAWTFSGERTDKTVHYIVQAVVTRQSTLEVPNGIAISSIAITDKPQGSAL